MCVYISLDYWLLLKILNRWKLSIIDFHLIHWYLEYLRVIHYCDKITKIKRGYKENIQNSKNVKISFKQIEKEIELNEWSFNSNMNLYICIIEISFFHINHRRIPHRIFFLSSYFLKSHGYASYNLSVNNIKFQYFDAARFTRESGGNCEKLIWKKGGIQFRGLN